jgi:hypothetical protein
MESEILGPPFGPPEARHIQGRVNDRHAGNTERRSTRVRTQECSQTQCTGPTKRQPGKKDGRRLKTSLLEDGADSVRHILDLSFLEQEVEWIPRGDVEDGQAPTKCLCIERARLEPVG